MTSKNIAVFGIYASQNQAERAVDTLTTAGFPSANISVLLADSAGTKDFAHEKNTKAPEGATTGVTAGGAIGGALGVLVGMGALAIPGGRSAHLGGSHHGGPGRAWQGLALAAPLADLSARWSAWVSRSTRLSATRDTLRTAAR